MRHSYLVLGTGMGRAIAPCLAEWAEFVAIADIDFDRAVDLAKNIELRFPIECEGIYFDARDLSAASRLFGGFDVMVSALPATYNWDLARLAIESGTNFCDLGGVLSVTLEMKNLHSEAVSKGVSVVPDCGLMPGLGVMIAKKLLDESIACDGIEGKREIVIYVGGLPQKPRPPLNYQRMFSLEGLRYLCYDAPAILRDGEVEYVEPLSELEYLNIGRLKQFSVDGRVEAFITAGASLAPWTFKELGVSSLCEKTIRWPGFVSFVSEVKEEDFISRIEPLTNIPVSEQNPDLVWLDVRLKHTKRRGDDKEWALTLFASYDVRTGLTAMEQTTGFTTALIAESLAMGKARMGVFTPDEALAVKGFGSISEIVRELSSYFEIRRYGL